MTPTSTFRVTLVADSGAVAFTSHYQCWIQVRTHFRSLEYFFVFHQWWIFVFWIFVFHQDDEYLSFEYLSSTRVMNIRLLNIWIFFLHQGDEYLSSEYLNICPPPGWWRTTGCRSLTWFELIKQDAVSFLAAWPNSSLPNKYLVGLFARVIAHLPNSMKRQQDFSPCGSKI